MKPYLLSGVVALGIVAFLSEYDVEDGMRATACLIHVGGSHSPVQTGNTLLSDVFSYKDDAIEKQNSD